MYKKIKRPIVVSGKKGIYNTLSIGQQITQRDDAECSFWPNSPLTHSLLTHSVLSPPPPPPRPACHHAANPQPCLSPSRLSPAPSVSSRPIRDLYLARPTIAPPPSPSHPRVRSCGEPPPYTTYSHQGLTEEVGVAYPPSPPPPMQRPS